MSHPSKSGFPLRSPAYQFAPTADKFNTGILVAKTWAGVPPRERDRTTLPFLHHPGYFNAAFGQPLAGATFGVIEPARYWGKQGAPVRPARSIVCNNTGLKPYSDLSGSGTDLARLSAGRVLLAEMNLENAGLSNLELDSNYYGFLGIGVPWASRATAAMAGGVKKSLVPTIDPATFAGGEVLFLFMTSIEGIDGLPCYYDPGFSQPDPAGRMTALLASDIAQVAAALGSFARVRWRLYGEPTAGAPAHDDAYYGGVVAPACVAAGLDFTYTPASGYSLAALRAEYADFFGI